MEGEEKVGMANCRLRGDAGGEECVLISDPGESRGHARSRFGSGLWATWTGEVIVGGPHIMGRGDAHLCKLRPPR